MTKLFTTTLTLNMDTLSSMMMTSHSFEFLVDTLCDEVEMHEHKDELIQLMTEQLLDDET